MYGRNIKVFVSATTKDLGLYREAVKNRLLAGDIQPVTQENFAPDYRDLLVFLRDSIAECDAVICLVGFLFGAAPGDESSHSYSYTQLEYLFAQEYKKPIFLFFAKEPLGFDFIKIEDQANLHLQEEYRKKLMGEGKKYETFSSLEELELKIAECVPKIHKLAGRLSLYYLHPPVRPSYFVGRKKEIEQFLQATKRKIPSVIAIIGMGGQGKTTLVHHALDHFRGLAYAKGFWCTAYRGGFSFDMFLDEALLFFSQSPIEIPRPSVEVRIQQMLRLLQENPVLIVIDGIERWLNGWNTKRPDTQFAETNEERKGSFEGLDEFLRAVSGLSNGTHLILTARAVPASLDDLSVSIIPIRDESDMDIGLEGLNAADAADLLEHLGIKGKRHQLIGIAQQYGCHPLALRTLAGLLRKRYGGQISHLCKVTPFNPQKELYMLFEETRINLPGREKSEFFLQCAASCFENPSLSLIIAGGWGKGSDEERLDQALEQAVTLADWNLIMWNGETQNIYLHPLLRAYFCSTLDPDVSYKIHTNLADWYESRQTPERPLTLEDSKARILAIKHASHAQMIDRCCRLMLSPFGIYPSFSTWLVENGYVVSGIDLCGSVLDHVNKGTSRGIFLLLRANFRHALEQLQTAIQDASEAITIFKKMLETCKRGNEKNCALLAQALACRANLVREGGRSSTALDDYDAAIRLMEVDINQRIDLAKTLANRGNALYDLGALTRATLDYEKAFYILEDISILNPYGNDSIMPSIQTNWGLVLADLGNWEKSIDLLQKAESVLLQLERENRNQDIRPLLHTEISLGSVLRRQGRIKEALDRLCTARDNLKKNIEAGRRDLASLYSSCLLNLAKCVVDSGRLEEAQRIAKLCLHLYEQLISKGEVRFTGNLAHAYFICAEINYRTGVFEHSKKDRGKGIELFKEWNLLWGDECDVSIVFFQCLINAVIYLLPTNSDEARDILDTALFVLKEMLSGPRSTEASRNEGERGIELLSNELLDQYCTTKQRDTIKSFQKFIANQKKAVEKIPFDSLKIQPDKCSP